MTPSRTSLNARPVRRVGIREVAQHAGVAMSSVSRVLTGHPDVSDVMRERVMLAVDELDYEPDWLAQSLRRQETKTIGFTMADISNAVMAKIVMGAEGVLRESGYSMLLMNSEGDGDRDAEHISALARRRVDGFLIATAAEGHRPTVNALREADAPIVVIDRNMPKSLRASAAYFDHRTGMREAAGHLLDLGHRRISLVLGQAFRPTAERRRGLEDAYSERGLPATFDVVEGRYSEQHGMEATERVLDLADPPTAIVAGSNQLLTGTLRVLKRRGLRIGENISLASCDEISLTELHDPPIAVVHRDNTEIGRRAAALLLERLEGEDEPETVTLPTSFEPRASCARLLED
jgi:LacI family transcriptional regulator